jgi:hypothetical protein
MFGRTQTGTGGRRRLQRTGLIASSVLVLGSIYMLPASAVHDTGSFELDGNANNQAAPGDDWDNVCHQVSATACPTPADTTGATAVDWVAEPNHNASIFTGGGSKDPQDISNWAWKDAGGLPDKDNLLHGFAARYNTNEGDVLYFGSDRLDNSGDAQQGFWFFQNSIAKGSNSSGGGFGFTGVHRAGDLLIISDFSNGGTVSTITVYSWDPTCKKTGGTCGDANLRTLASSTNANCATAGANDAFCGLVNANTITMPWSFTDKSGTPNNGALNGEFYEGGVNLTRLGLADRCFASVASETRSSTSTTATLKDFILGGFGSCGSSVTTQQSVSGGSTSIGTGSVSVSDSATVTVTGIASWNGTVQFHLLGPIGAANELSTDIGSPVAVSNTTPTVSSSSASVTAAGDYCWSAHFASGTTGVPDGDDTGANECFTITPVTPTLATTAGDDVLLGQAISDTAALSGTANKPGTPAINPTTAGGPAGGTITFTAYGPNDCSTVAFTSTPQTVSGNGTYGPVSFTPTAVGTYHWVASYSGDSPNTNPTDHNTACNDTNEDVVVRAVPSSLTSAQRWVPNDSVTVSAAQGGDLAGSVTFTLYPSNNCTGTPVYTVTRTVAGASSQTVTTANTTAVTATGDYSWQVNYDSTNPAQLDIAASCHETSSVTIANGGTISSS